MQSVLFVFSIYIVFSASLGFADEHNEESHSHAVFAPGTPQEYVDSFDDSPLGESGELSPNFIHRSRWSNTATNGFGLSQGDPTTITWSIVPDGTEIPALGGIGSESADPSNLVAYLGGIYGVTTNDNNYTDEPWFSHFQNVFDRLSEISGVTYIYEPNDDGARFSTFWYSAPGEIGTRGDVRIGGHAIDGNSGILAYNFFPNHGEMVIDTADNYYSNVTNNSLRLRNIVSHEAGHGIGLDHVVSNNANFLMEPYLSTAFEGPQFDDILGAQRHYGDNYEPNDTTGTASSLGSLSAGAITIGEDSVDAVVAVTDTSFISVDGTSDTDFFSFSVSEATDVEITLSPLGPTYNQGAQGGSQSSFNALEQSNLVLELRDTNGSTVLVSADVNPVGQNEVISYSLPSAGTYYVKVSSTTNAIQMYQLALSGNSNTTVSISGTIDGDEAGPVNGVFTVTQTAIADADTVLTYSVSGSSTSGSDFTALSGSVTITSGTTSSTITVPVIDDGQVESTETVVVTLTGITSSSSGVSINVANDDDSINILDNDVVTARLTSITRKTPSTGATNSDTLVFLATFNEAVQNVNASDFVASGTTASISVSQLTSSTYDVTLSGGNLASLNGLVGLDLNNPSITDLSGNPLPDIEPDTDETYFLDNAVPVLNSFARKTPSAGSTNSDTLVFLATFNEAVQNVNASDFVASGTTASVSVSQLTSSTYDVTLLGGDLASINGTVGLNLNNPSITDLNGNALPNSEPGIDQTYQLDNTAPVLISFTRKTPGAETTNSDTLVFLATFNEAVRNVNASDFVASGTTASVSVSQLTGSSYDVTLLGGDLASINGTVGLNLNNPSITDLNGNALPNSEPGIDQTYQLDNSAPDDNDNDNDDDNDDDRDRDSEGRSRNILDFDGDEISEWGVYAKKGRGRNRELLHNFTYVEYAYEELFSFGDKDSYPVYADYDGDGITDFAYFNKKRGRRTRRTRTRRGGLLSLNIEQSSDNQEQSFSFGKASDAIIGNCYFDSDSKADPIAIAKRRALIRLSGTNTNERITLPRMKSFDVTCADLDGDSIYEVVFLTKANRRIRRRLRSRSAHVIIAIDLNGNIVMNQAVSSVVGRKIIAVDKDNNGTHQILYFQRSSNNRRVVSPSLVDINGEITNLEIEVPKFSNVTHARFITNDNDQANGLLFQSRNKRDFMYFNFDDLILNIENIEGYLSGSEGVGARGWSLMQSQAKYGN